jgi:hypothetical protein
MSIGADVSYFIWNPAWNNEKIIMYQNNQAITMKDFPKYEPIQTLLYGPKMSFSFLNKWGISASYRYGQYRLIGSNIGFNYMGTLGYVSRDVDNTLTHHEISGSLAYNIFKFIFLRAGLRTILVNNEFIYTIGPITVSDFFRLKMTSDTVTLIPRVGTDFRFEVTDFFTVGCNADFVFLSGSEKYDFKRAFNQSGLTMIGGISVPMARFYGVGFGTGAMVKLNIPVINLSLDFSLNYTVLQFIQKGDDRGLYRLDKETDQTVYTTFLVSYTFSLRPKRKRVWIPRPSKYD